MATLLKDDAGIPIPQYINKLGGFEGMKGADGAIYAYVSQLETTNVAINDIQSKVASTNAVLTSIAKTTGSDTIFQLLYSIVSTIASAVNDLTAAVDTLSTDVAAIKQNSTQSTGYISSIPGILTQMGDKLIDIKADTATLVINTTPEDTNSTDEADDTGGA